MSFIISALFANTIFLVNSPRVRPDLGSYLTTGFSNNIVMPLSQVFGSLAHSAGMLAKVDMSNTQPSQNPGSLENANADSIIKALQSTQFAINSPGMYSKQNTTVSYTLVKEREVEWLAYTVDINGQQITVYVPKGEQPPTPQMIQKTLGQ